MEPKQSKRKSAVPEFGLPSIDMPDVLLLGNGEKTFLGVKEPEARGKMKKKNSCFEPDFTIACPGGADAKFLYKRGNELFWRGEMPYGDETAAGSTHKYTLITDMAGNEIRTEE